jgi:hypothetical protein
MSRETTPRSPDVDAELACRLDATSKGTRVARWQALADRALVESARVADGARQRYRGGAAIEEELRELVDLERECCPFLEVRFDRAGRELILKVSGPAEAAPIIEAFATGRARA